MFHFLFSDVDEGQDDCLFNKEVFREHICPKLIEIFKVHEVQIRLILLHYLPKFVQVFTREELQRNVLPEVKIFQNSYRFKI